MEAAAEDLLKPIAYWSDKGIKTDMKNYILYM